MSRTNDFPPPPRLPVMAVAVLLAFYGLSGAGFGAERLEGPVSARVVRVIDGDTFIARARIWLGQEVETRVRLDGIDAPELRGSCDHERALAVRARDRLAKLVGDKDAIALYDIRFDKYGGRVLARATLDGRDLGSLLLDEGLARPYDGGTRGGWCE